MINWRCILISIFLTYADAADSQSANYRFENISEQFGEVHVSVNCVIQDHLGFLWFGTNVGLYRFDGNQFKAYLHDALDSTSLSSPGVNDFVEDSEGQIWSASNYGINLLDRRTGRFRSFAPNDKEVTTKGLNNINKLFSDSSNRLWAIASNKIYLFDKTTEKFKKLKSAEESVEIFTFLKMEEAGDGSIWLASTRGMFRIDPDNLTFEFIHLKNESSESELSISAITHSKDGRIWLATMNGLAKINTDNESITEVQLPNQFNEKPIADLKEASDNKLWLAFENNGLGVYELDSEVMSYFNHDDDIMSSLQDNDINCILEDRFQNIWLGTGIGITKTLTRTSGFNFFQNKNGIEQAANKILRIHKDGQSNIWLITVDGLYRKSNNEMFGVKVDLPFDYKKYELGDWMYEDTESAMWIPATGLGLFRKSLNASTFSQVTVDSKLTNSRVYKIIEDANNDTKLWIGTSNGLCEFDRTDFKSKWHLPQDQILGLSTNRFSIFEQFGNDIWLYYTYFNSLGKFNKSTGIFELFRPSKDDQFMLEGAIKDIAISSDGNVWLASLYGLTRYNIAENSYHLFTSHDGLAENTLNAVLVDTNNDIWVSGNQFVSKFDRKRERFQNFNAADKVKSFGSKTKFIDDNGKMYFGGLNGVYSFHPDSIQLKSGTTEIVLIDFKVEDETFLLEKAFEYTKKIVLEHDQNDIAFRFSSMQFNDVQSIEYRCILKGYDRDWRYLGKGTLANYTNLNPGHYVFLVQATNQDGEWNQEELNISLLITPPFTQTNWFMSMIALLFAILFYILYRIRDYQLSLRREKEMAEKSSEYRMRFLSHASHEIRTPMNAIIGLSGLVKETNLDLQQKKYISAIEQSSHNLLQIINELLDQNKIESGKFTVKRDPFSLELIMEQLEAMFNPLVKQKNLILRINLPNDLPAMIMGDALRLTQILTNLIGNSIKFTEKGFINLNITTSKKNDNDLIFQFEVNDTGIGISEERLPYVFDRFESDQKMKESMSSGLGLFITKELVEAQKGTIHIKSKLEFGTTVTCRIAFEMANEQTNESIGVTEDYDFGKLTILIVDDEPFNHLVASELLKKKIPNVQTISVNSGAEGIEAFSQNEIDLIIMDVKMPVMNGLEATQKIRSLSDRGKTIPILGATAGALPNQISECLESGMNDVITKPINVHALIQKIIHLLKNRS